MLDKVPTADVSLDEANRKLSITWPDGFSSAYHYVWLRHSARCPKGMPNDTSIKIDLLPDDPATLRITGYEIDQDDLIVKWVDDNLVTLHDLSTLKASAYDKCSRARRKRPPVLWGASNASEIPMFDYTCLHNDENVLQIQCAIRDYGLARLENVPVTPGTIADVAEHFGPVHVNNYGRVFDVKTDTNVTLGSNTGAYLGPHTDEGYRHAPPGITFFHCLKAAEQGGGESILVDGFSAAEKLRQCDPESFEVLCRVPILWQRQALPEEDMRAYGRVIVTDLDGDVQGIRFTDRTIPPQDLPDKSVEPVYKAIRGFWNIVNADEMKFIKKMRPGDLNIFDNQRVLHGRMAFDPTKNERYLQQCSVNRDEFHNSLRVRAARLDPAISDLTMGGGTVA